MKNINENNKCREKNIKTHFQTESYELRGWHVHKREKYKNNLII